MSEGYQIVDRADSPSPLDPKKLAEVLAKEGEFLLPIVNLIETRKPRSTISSTSSDGPRSKPSCS